MKRLHLKLSLPPASSLQRKPGADLCDVGRPHPFCFLDPSTVLKNSPQKCLQKGTSTGCLHELKPFWCLGKLLMKTVWRPVARPDVHIKYRYTTYHSMRKARGKSQELLRLVTGTVSGRTACSPLRAVKRNVQQILCRPQSSSGF